MTTRLVWLSAMVLCMACSPTKKMEQQTTKGNDNILLSLMQSRQDLFGSIIQSKNSLQVQVIYTRIDRDANNKPRFTDYKFNLDDSRYFYPASTVKMPIAFLALEKLNELRIAGLDHKSAMLTNSNHAGQQPELSHPNAPLQKSTIGQYIKEIFLVSDNEAFNRLYEFLGQKYINKRLHKKGYESAQILHRLSVPMTEDENRHTDGISFYDTSNQLLYKQPPAYNTERYAARFNLSGKGYYKGGDLIKEPFDFSKKNRVSLSDLHQVLRSVIFPEAVPQKQRFNISDDDYRFLYRYMSMYPGESEIPAYHTSDYRPAYVKFLLHGSKKGELPAHIRIFNKVGNAYGFLTDVAYIVDYKNKVEFMLSATILCNSDGIFNDDRYDYETVGFPFMKNLGQVIYDYELQRKRAFAPDVSRFQFTY